MGADGTEALDAADRPARETDLPLDQGAVEGPPEHARRVAEPPLPCPDPDAGRLRLVGIHFLVVPHLEAPGEDRAQPDFPRNVLHGERLPLDDLVPGGGGPHSVAAAATYLAQEAEHDAEPMRGDADGREIGDGLAVSLPENTVATDRAERPDGRRRRIDLADDVGDLRNGEPPGDCVTAPGERRLAHEERWMRPVRREVLQIGEDVRAVLRGRGRPGCGGPGAEELVLDDQGRRAPATGG